MTALSPFRSNLVNCFPWEDNYFRNSFKFNFPLDEVTFTTSEEGLMAELDLPGVSEENLKVDVKDQRITVEGQRKNSQVSRTFLVPQEYDATKGQATLSLGVLTLFFPTRPEHTATQIPVQVKD